MTAAREAAAPPVSVVVPARNEAATLPSLLTALLRQSFVPAQIIVVNAGSTDRTSTVVASVGDRRVHLLDAGPVFPGAARNLGIERAQHDWVALIDAGCIPDHGWLEALVECGLRDWGPQGGVVWGNYRPHVSTLFDAAQALVIGPLRRRPGDPAARSVASSLLHREQWRRVGRFREDLRAAEDLLFFNALRAAGTLESHASAVVQWDLAPSYGAFFRRLRTYSRYHAGCGLWKSWHLRVAFMDAAALVVCILGLSWPLGLPMLGLAALLRVGMTIWKRRGNVPLNPWMPGLLARVSLLLLLADLAMWGGLLDLMRRGTNE